MARQVSSFVARTIRTAIGIAVMASAATAAQNGSAAAPKCETGDRLISIAELPEGSGVAASRRSPGRFWAHNDSGEPVLIALDSRGAVAGRVRASGAKVEDWEALAVGPCPAGSCIYVGDIGDNDGERRHVTIYRLPEPADASGSAAVADVIRATYPDGPRDAEALLVTPKGEILIVTKGDPGPVALYRFPPDAKPDATVTLERIGKPRGSGKTAADERITDGAVSPDGSWVALRTQTAVILYRTADFMKGSWQEAGRVGLTALREPQGEGITFGDDRTIYLIGEGGGKARPGTFARVTCAF
jgi:hypothetical protein